MDDELQTVGGRWPDELAPPTENEKVTSWRLEQLLGAGYSVSIAERLAADFEVDLHQAVDLVRKGCRPVVAALILL